VRAGRRPSPIDDRQCVFADDSSTVVDAWGTVVFQRQTRVTVVPQEVLQVPALPFVPNVVKVVVEGTTPVYPWANIFHWAYTGTPPPGATCAVFAEDIDGYWATNFAPLMATAATIEKVTVVDLASDIGGEGEYAHSTPGSGGTDDLPASAAVLLSKGIDRRYRGGHPRSYIFAGQLADLLDSGHWTGAFTAAVDAAYAAFTASVNALTHSGTAMFGEVTVSYISKEVNPVAPYRRAVPLVLPVTSFAAESEIASQRRRVGR
jgi:hypothetical protein